MFTIETHELAAQELAALPDRLRGQVFRLIERLQTGGQLKMPHSRVIGGGLFELRAGGVDIVRTLYAYSDGQKIFLLHAFVKKTEKTPASAIRLARQRLEDFFT